MKPLTMIREWLEEHKETREWFRRRAVVREALGYIRQYGLVESMNTYDVGAVEVPSRFLF